MTSETTKAAMMRDLGSRDPAFTSTIDTIKSGLLKVAGASEADWVAVLMQGSGTFSVEAVFQTAIPRDNAKVSLKNALFKTFKSFQFL